jgi:flagellar biosynthetic protein FliR
MQIALDPVALVGFLLAFARAFGFVVVALPFALPVVPRIAQVGIAVAFGIGTEPLAAHAPLPATAVGLIGLATMQLVIGAVLGFCVMLFLSLGESAGGLVGILGGFATPPSLDPLTANEVPITGQFYNLLWIVLFFVSGADVVVVQGYAQSFAAASFVHPATGVALVVRAVTILFASSLEVASPVLAVMFLSQVVVGILVKVAPQLYALTFLFPLQILLSLILMIISVPILPHLFDAGIRDLLALERDILGG